MRTYGVILGVLLLIPIISGCTTVYERPAPPPVKVEIRTPPPYKAAVWVPGHWRWRGRRRGYVWVPGHWRRR